MTTTDRPVVTRRHRRPTSRSSFRRATSAVLAFAVALSTVVALLATGASVAGAHTGEQSYLYLDVTEVSLSGRVEAPVRDLNEGLGLTLAGTDEEVLAELEANRDELHEYFGQHLSISSDGVEWPITFEGVELFESDDPEIDDGYIVFPLTVDVSPGLVDGKVPRVFDVGFDPFFDEIEDRDAIVLIGNDWKAGVIDNGATPYATYDAGNRLQEVDLGNTGWTKNLYSSAKLGVNHIKTGPDHILFVLVLLLPSVLVFAGTWRPAPSFTSALWRVLKIVTMFTAAHSITFTLAGIGILPLPSPRIVESIIAISIAAAALHNIRPIAANKEWLISFAFGLFHGMGFASLVSGLDVDRGTQLVSLVGRNIGIEVGQAIVILLLFPALFLLRRTRYYRPFLIGFSILLAIVSVGWMIERVFEIDLGVSGLVDPVVEWPRVLIYIAVLTAVAFALERTERANGRLLDVGPDLGGGDDRDAVTVS